MANLAFLRSNKKKKDKMFSFIPISIPSCPSKLEKNPHYSSPPRLYDVPDMLKCLNLISIIFFNIPKPFEKIFYIYCLGVCYWYWEIRLKKVDIFFLSGKLYLTQMKALYIFLAVMSLKSPWRLWRLSFETLTLHCVITSILF